MTGEPIPNTAGLEFPIKVVPPKPRGSGRVWYRRNHRSFGAFMRSDQMRDVTEEVAMDIALKAREKTPEGLREAGDEDPDPHMRDQYEVVRNAGFMKVSGNLRVKVEVVNDSRHAAAIEFGRSNVKSPGTGGRRPLLRAGAEFGDVKLDGSDEA